MRNIRLKLAYDGTNYHGFQRQDEAHGPTVQGTLEAVWARLVEEKITLAMAGRTDAGVHASGQIVNFMTAARIPEEKSLRHLTVCFQGTFAYSRRSVLRTSLMPDGQQNGSAMII